MKMRGILKLLSLLTIIAMLAGCNMFKSFDKPTDKEERDYKKAQAEKNANYDELIGLLEQDINNLQGEEKEEALQKLGDAYLGKAGVNVLDIAATFSETDDSTTSSSVNTNDALMKTLNSVDFEALEKADAYYDQLLADLPAASIKRNIATTTDTKRKELYLSAALAKALLAANYLAIVIYDFEEGDRIKIEIDGDTATAYLISPTGEKIYKTPVDADTLKANWIEFSKKNIRFGKLIVNNLLKTKQYILLAIDTEDSDIKETIEDFIKDIQIYGDADSIDDLDQAFEDYIRSFEP